MVLTGAGAGGVLGSLVYLRLQKTVGFGWLFLGGLGVALLMWLAAAIAPTPLFLAAVALCAMASEQVSSVAQYTVRLALIPDHLRGRVNSAYRLLLMLTQPIGIAGVGFLVQRMGTGPTILLCSLVLGLTLAAGLGVTSLRAVGTHTGVTPRDLVSTTDASTADMPQLRASSPETVTETVLATSSRRQEIDVVVDVAWVPPGASATLPGHPVDQACGDRRRTGTHQCSRRIKSDTGE
jgi:MFS family permease